MSNIPARTAQPELYAEMRQLYDNLVPHATPPETADGFNVTVPIPMLDGDAIIGANNIKHRKDIKWGSATLSAVGHEAGLSVVVDRIHDHHHSLRRVGLFVSYLAGNKVPVFTGTEIPDVFDGFFLDYAADGQASLHGLSDGRMYGPRHPYHHTKLFIVASMRALGHVEAVRARTAREAHNVSAA